MSGDDEAGSAEHSRGVPELMLAGENAEAQISLDDEGVEQVPPHLIDGPLPRSSRPDYVLVIPSYDRPKMLGKSTFNLLLQQQVPLDRVFVFVSDEQAPGQVENEYTRYSKEVVPKGLPLDHIIVGKKGILHQRNFIVDWVINRFGELQHVVSIDDDVESLSYKVRDGFDDRGGELGYLRQLEVGGLEAWIAHAERGMLKYDCFIWSLNTSNNPYFMRSNIIGTGNGMCNGYLYGFRARKDRDLLPHFSSVTEDRERSVRYFAKDGIQLRYKMYCAQTRCFENPGGIQSAYNGTILQKSQARRVDEIEGHKMILVAFPSLYKFEEGRTKRLAKTMLGGFHRLLCKNISIQSGLRPDLEPRRRGEGGRDWTRKQKSLPEVNEVNALQRGSSRESSAKEGKHARGVAAYRAAHGKLTQIPDGWSVEKGKWSSGAPFTKYRCATGGRVVYSLTQLEAFLGDRMLQGLPSETQQRAAASSDTLSDPLHPSDLSPRSSMPSDKSPRSSRHAECVAAYRAVHGKLTQAPEGWTVETGAWASGHVFRYRCTAGGRICMSLPQVEAVLGARILQESASDREQQEDIPASASNRPAPDLGPAALEKACVADASLADSGTRHPDFVEFIEDSISQREASPLDHTVQGESSQMWTCTTCTLKNSDMVLVCVACNETRQDPTAWACLRCQTCSPADDEACVGCGLERTQNERGKFDMYVDSDSDFEEEQVKVVERSLPAILPSPPSTTSSSERSSMPVASKPGFAVFRSFSGTVRSARHIDLSGPPAATPRAPVPPTPASMTSASESSHTPHALFSATSGAAGSELHIDSTYHEERYTSASGFKSALPNAPSGNHERKRLGDMYQQSVPATSASEGSSSRVARASGSDLTSHANKRQRCSSPSGFGLGVSNASSSAQISVSRGESWHCAVCTFENDKMDAPVCEICQQPREG